MITHDRWQRIKAIFNSAQDRPPAERTDFLNEVCRDDPSVREEVEALLTADAGNDDFLSSPAYEFAAGMLADEPSEFLAGQKIGRFEILCSLGAGGMGQIYLAHDGNLGRKIALKLIAREFATDTRRVHRFEQEARAASALNHPNVCVIHDIGRTETGRHFIAMEYIQGITLRDQLARGTFKPLEALQVTLQVGAALASAHAIGTNGLFWDRDELDLVDVRRLLPGRAVGCLVACGVLVVPPQPHHPVRLMVHELVRAGSDVLGRLVLAELVGQIGRHDQRLGP